MRVPNGLASQFTLWCGRGLFPVPDEVDSANVKIKRSDRRREPTLNALRGERRLMEGFNWSICIIAAAELTSLVKD